MGGNIPHSPLTQAGFQKLRQLPESLPFINQIVEELQSAITDEFNVLVSLWQKGHYEKIVRLGDELPLHCLCDVRIAAYYLYSLWQVHPATCLADIVAALINLLSHPQRPWLAVLEPNHRQQSWPERVFNSSLVVILRKLMGSLQKNTCTFVADGTTVDGAAADDNRSGTQIYCHA